MRDALHHRDYIDCANRGAAVLLADVVDAASLAIGLADACHALTRAGLAIPANAPEAADHYRAVLQALLYRFETDGWALDSELETLFQRGQRQQGGRDA